MIRSLVLSLALLSVPAGQAFAALYMVDRSTDELYTANTSTGVLTSVGALGINGIEGMAYDAAGDVLYGVSNNTDQLVTINRSTGAATVVGNLGISADLRSLAIDSSGNLYSYNLNSKNLTSIDKNTGAATDIGHVGNNKGTFESLAFDSNDVLYGLSIGQASLATFNLTSGVASLINNGATSPNNNIFAAAFDGSDGLFAVDVLGDDYLSIDLVTSADTKLLSLSGAGVISAMSFVEDSVSVGVPGGLGLLLAGLMGMRIRRR